MSLVILSAALALAGDVTAEVDGTVVRGSAHLPIPPERFLAQLRDPAWEPRISGTGTQVTVEGEEGDCQHLAMVSPNPIFQATYEVRRCPTPDGWHAFLITSNAFSAYSARWRAAPEADGARVTYEVDLTTSLAWVPNSLVRSETRRSVLKMMKAIERWAEGERATAP